MEISKNYYKNSNQFLLEKLNSRIKLTHDLFNNKSFFSKLKLYFKFPKKSIYRKVISHILRQKYEFILKTKTFWGAKMYVNNYEPHLWFSGLLIAPCEIRLTKYLIKRLKSGDTFLDLGAHHGFFSRLASRLVGVGGQVHSFEPIGKHFKILKKNNSLSKNSISNRVAVFSKDGIIDFFENKKTESTFDKSLFYVGNEEFSKVRVESLTLSKYCEDKKIIPDLIKIDVEGSEYEVLKGAYNVIVSYFPDIVMEVWGDPKNNSNHSKAISFLFSKGYKMYRIDKNGDLILLKSFDINKDVPEGIDNFVFLKLYNPRSEI